MILIGAIIGVLLYVKGYIKLPGGGGGGKSESLGRRFIDSIQKEAQDEVADMIAQRMKEDVKARLHAPFAVARPDPDPSAPK
jgi:hypothetical protein